jgi:hypothetical protein
MLSAVHLCDGTDPKTLLPKRQVNLDLYLMHQNDSRSSPPHVNALGVALVFYF